MNATLQINTESTAFVFLNGQYLPVKAPGGYPEKWFCSGTLDEVQALMRLEVLAFYPRTVLIITREIKGGAQ